MIVFKNYFKILKKHLGLILMFIGITIGISIANTSVDNSSQDYIATNPKIAIISRDSSALTDDFIKYVDDNAELIQVEDDKKEIQDALYYAKVSAVLIIPENYSANFFAGNKPEIEIKKSAQNFSTYVELLVNRYFKIANIYNATGMSEDEIISKIKTDLDKEIKIEIDKENDKSDLSRIAVFFSFENYAMISIIILSIGTIMCIFNNENIKKRNIISKLASGKFNMQLFLGHVVLTLGVWALFVIASIAIYGKIVFTTGGLLMVANSLILAITVASMAYLISTFIKNQNVLSGVQNVFGLGLSFISGCFVPSSLLSKEVTTIAKAFPSYWYVDANYKIAEMSNFDFESLKPIFTNFAIVLGYGVLYFVIRKVLYRVRMKKN